MKTKREKLRPEVIDFSKNIFRIARSKLVNLPRKVTDYDNRFFPFFFFLNCIFLPAALFLCIIKHIFGKFFLFTASIERQYCLAKVIAKREGRKIPKTKFHIEKVVKPITIKYMSNQSSVQVRCQ